MLGPLLLNVHVSSRVQVNEEIMLHEGMVVYLQWLTALYEFASLNDRDDYITKVCEHEFMMISPNVLRQP